MKAAMKLGAAHTLRAGKLAAAWTETVNTFGSRWKMLAVPSPCPGFCRESQERHTRLCRKRGRHAKIIPDEHPGPIRGLA